MGTQSQKTESKGEIVESAIQAAFLEIIARGDGTEFCADDIVARASKNLPANAMKGILARKLGLGFRKLKALHLIHQTPRAIKSTRNDGALLQIWRVGRAQKVEPLNSDTSKARSDFGPSKIHVSKGRKKKRTTADF